MMVPGPAVPDWLTARPIAHRGLHDRKANRFENTVSAALAAVDRGYAIECDVQRSADGEAVVFHDATLDRLTTERGRVGSFSAAALAALSIGGSGDRIVSLATFLSAIGGRVPLICEIKSAFDGDIRLADRVAAVAGAYQGPLALKSFDPLVIRHLRQSGETSVPLGIVAEARYCDPEWAVLDAMDRQRMAALVHLPETEPAFLSYAVDDLPHAATTLFKLALGRPVIAWTVRTSEQRQRAVHWTDQIVFEGFTP